MRPRHQGFSMVELMLVVALAAIALAIAIPMAMGRQDNTRRMAAIADHAAAMAELTAASRAFATELGYGWLAGPRQIAVSELITSGRLPQGWRAANGEVGVTPLGQRFVASVEKAGTPEAVEYRIIVSETGNVLRAAAARAGIDAGSSAKLAGYKNDLAARLRSQHALHAGVTDAAAVNVGLVGGSGTMPIAPHSPTPPIASVAVAVLDGYPQLGGGNGCEGAACRPGRGPNFTQCTVALPIGGLTGTTASCPSGYQEVARWKHCRALGSNDDPVTVTPAGPVLFGPHTTYDVALLPCGACNPSIDSACGSAPTKSPICSTGLLDRDAGVNGDTLFYSYSDYGICLPPDDPDTITLFRQLVDLAIPAAHAQSCVFYSINSLLDRRIYQDVYLNSGLLIRYQCAHNRWRTATGAAVLSPSPVLPTNGPEDIMCCR